MAKEPNPKPHSEDYFTEARNFWWNDDFLHLLGNRWGLASSSSVLDVGCGLGHWGRTLGAILPQTATVIGIDQELCWIEQAQQQASQLGLSDRFRYQVGLAAQLPFAAATFDLVTCQTVLIHIADPKEVIDEMLRVLRPGGLLLVAEPNNLVSSLSLNSVTAAFSVDQLCDRVRFQLICEQGKIALGEGNNSVGELLLGYFTEVGLKQIQVYLSDKAFWLAPPYDSLEQAVIRQAYLDGIRQQSWVWDEQQTRRFFLAGGGTEADFEIYWQQVLQENQQCEQALLNHSFYTSGGTMLYLVSGRKADPEPEKTRGGQ